jgi:hypothetical protein
VSVVVTLLLRGCTGSVDRFFPGTKISFLCYYFIVLSMLCVVYSVLGVSSSSVSLGVLLLGDVARAASSLGLLVVSSVWLLRPLGVFGCCSSSFVSGPCRSALVLLSALVCRRVYVWWFDPFGSVWEGRG